MKTTTLLYALLFISIGVTSLFSISDYGIAISPKNYKKLKVKKSKKFDSYWNNGLAELSSYELKQARYGEIHNGEAILIFVTEPFSKSKQVKLDNWRSKKDRVDVLKLNAIKKFETGIYPYSTMQSVFSSLNNNRLIKATSSVQEWCGQVFMQFNTDGKHLNYFGRSYFKEEGDQQHTLNKTYLEDELWNMIRINPKDLPIGKHQIIPSTLFLRFNHHSVNEYEANFTLHKKDSLSVYKIEYHKPEPRTLTIQFKTEFPHTILGWEEEYEDIAWNSERKILKTTATLKKSIRLDYWNKNKIEHQKLKQLLK